MHPRTNLILSGVAIVLIWQLPYGELVLYPFSLLSTYAHEMGHGLTALLVGARFDALHIHADGSGMAVWQGSPTHFDTALVAAGGLAGPTLAGTGLLLLSRWSARAVLALLAVLIALSVALWSRNTFGVVYLLSVAATLAIAAKVLPDIWAAFLLHLVAVTLCLSWWTDLSYMFAKQAIVNGLPHPSDSAVIAQALGFPWWFGGGLVALLSLTALLLLLGTGWVIRKR